MLTETVATTVTNTLTISEFMTYVCVFGALGSLAQLASSTLIKGDFFVHNEERIVTKGHWAFLIGSHVLSGISSSIAIFFILHFLMIMKFDTGTADISFLAATSTIAGFAFNRLLPRYASSLELKLDSLERKTEKTAVEAREASLLARIQPALREGSPAGDREMAVALLRDGVSKNPLDRSLVIPLGKVLRLLGHTELAIDVLTKFIDKKRELGTKDKDYADVLFNRACYYSILYSRSGSSKKDKDQSAQRALADLKESVSLSNDNKKEARTDEHLLLLNDLNEFKVIVGE